MTGGAGCADGGCCSADGNPFGPFWRYSHVEFRASEYFGAKVHSQDLRATGVREQWFTE
jgi:hypothetical protein